MIENWKSQQQNSGKTIKDFEKYFKFRQTEKDAINQLGFNTRIEITPYLLSLIQKDENAQK